MSGEEMKTALLLEEAKNNLKRYQETARASEDYWIRRQRKKVLEECRRIAVVGASPDPDSKSYLSIEKLSGLGLEVIPVLPVCQSYLGLPCYNRLAEVPGEIDIVQVYPGAGVDLLQMAKESVQKGARAFWVEEGQADVEIKKLLANSGVQLIEREILEREYIKQALFVFAGRGPSQTERRPVPVSTCMTRHPVTVKPADAIKETLEKMERGHFRHLPVVDDDGKLIGILSDRDIRLIHPSPLFVRPEHAPAQLLMIKVRQVAVFNPVAIGPDASLGEAAKLMLRWEIGALPVVSEGGVLVGIITYADLLREFLAREKQG